MYRLAASPKALKAAIERARDRDLSRMFLYAAGDRQVAYSVHLIVAALFFSPFLLFGHIMAADSDLLIENFPMLLLAKREFLHGFLGLWNPYSFSGIPQSAEASTPILFPENWILFLIPLRFLFPAITFVAFIKMWLIGNAAHRFYYAELLNRRWALFASLAYQLSGMVIWFFGTYIGLSILLYYTILLALVWTQQHRSNLANYLLLSAVTTLMLMAGNISHAAYALLGAGVLVLYRTFSRRGVEPMIRLLVVFTASSATALSIFCVRLLPIIATMGSGFIASNCCKPLFLNASFLIARFFDTEILGVNYVDSLTFFKNISPVFDYFHLHWVAPEFFGVAVALLALWALASEKSTKAIFWSVYVIIGLAAVMFVQPFDTVAKILLSPIWHIIGLQIILMVGFPALAALGGISLERSMRHGQLSHLTVELVIFGIITVALFVLMIVIRNVEVLSVVGSNWSRSLVVGLFIFAGLAGLIHHARPKMFKALTLSTLSAILALGLVISFFVAGSNATFLSHLKNLGVELALFAAIAIVLVLIARGRVAEARQLGFWGAPILLLLSLYIILHPWTRTLRPDVLHSDGLYLAGLGALRFALGVMILFLVVSAAKAGRLPARGVYIVFLMLLLAEQIPAGKIHSHINENPFYPADTFYPPMEPLIDSDGHAVDLADYRVNFPNTLLQLPFQKELWGPYKEMCSSTNVAYGVRSYGGFTDIIPARTAWFLANWAEAEDPVDYCIYAHQTDDRFLDLSGVGYAYDTRTRTISRRPSALSRTMLFTRFEITTLKEGDLHRLKETDFRPLEEIILQADPGFQSRASTVNGQKLHFTEVNSDRIDVQVRTDGPALLFFDDSFNSDWIARVNGAPQKVMIANYNFMAIPVPAGESWVVLEYKPRSFTIGLICALVGLSALALAFAAYLLTCLRGSNPKASAS